MKRKRGEEDAERVSQNYTPPHYLPPQPSQLTTVDAGLSGAWPRQKWADKLVFPAPASPTTTDLISVQTISVSERILLRRQKSWDKRMSEGANMKVEASASGPSNQSTSASLDTDGNDVEIEKIKGRYHDLLHRNCLEEAIGSQEEGMLQVQQMYGGVERGDEGSKRIEDFAEHLILALNSVALRMLEPLGGGNGEEEKKSKRKGKEEQKASGSDPLMTPRSPPKGKKKKKKAHEERHAWNYGSGANMKPPGDPMQVITKIQKRMKAALFGSDIKKFFQQMDKDGSGSLDEEEVRGEKQQGWGGKHRAPNMV
jgi:hypothetical protein